MDHPKAPALGNQGHCGVQQIGHRVHDPVQAAWITESTGEMLDQPRVIEDVAQQQKPGVTAETLGPYLYTNRAIERRLEQR